MKLFRLYRLRHKETGLFFSSRKWGQSNSKAGKFYDSEPRAWSALKLGVGEKSVKEYELVKYQVEELK